MGRKKPPVDPVAPPSTEMASDEIWREYRRCLNYLRAGPSYHWNGRTTPNIGQDPVLRLPNRRGEMGNIWQYLAAKFHLPIGEVKRQINARRGSNREEKIYIVADQNHAVWGSSIAASIVGSRAHVEAVEKGDFCTTSIPEAVVFAFAVAVVRWYPNEADDIADAIADQSNWDYLASMTDSSPTHVHKLLGDALSMTLGVGVRNTRYVMVHPPESSPGRGAFMDCDKYGGPQAIAWAVRLQAERSNASS